MAFLQEGDIPVAIAQILISESTLNKKPNSFDICVEVCNEEGTQRDWWRGNLSADWTKIKNRNGQTNTQVTHENMVQLGYRGPDFSAWPNQMNFDWNQVIEALQLLVGIRTSAHVAASACGQYMNVKWLGGGGSAPVAIDINMLSGMMNQGQAQQQPQAQQPVQQAQQPVQQVQQQQPMNQGQQQPVATVNNTAPQQQQAAGGFGNPNQQPQQ